MRSSQLAVGQSIDSFKLKAAAEGLSTLSELRQLKLPCLCGHLDLAFDHHLCLDYALSDALKQAVEDMKSTYWPLMKEKIWR
jgi:hypothetical protein